MKVYVRLHRPDSWYGRAISFITRSPFSHTSVQVRDMVFQAEWRSGTTVHAAEDVPPAAEVCPVELTISEGAALAAFLYQQVGKPYDLKAVLRFLAFVRFLAGDDASSIQAARKARGRWFCSELVFAAFQHIDKSFLLRVEPWQVSPALLSMSPLLIAEDPPSTAGSNPAPIRLQQAPTGIKPRLALA